MATDPTARLRAAVTAKKAAEKEEVAAIVEALTPGSGVLQKDVIAITGYSREHVRRLARENGIEAAARGGGRSGQG